jgi:acetyltransferase-like isoleucine patch superfamily enzyme
MTRSRAFALVRAILLFLLPTFLVRRLVNLLGGKVQKGARVGFSILVARSLYLEAGCRIGHGSLVNIRRLILRAGAYIGHSNVCTGPFDIWLAHQAGIGNRNVISRAPIGVTWGAAQLRLGRLSKVTASHKIDCTRSVIFGHFSTLAGQGSQIWSHGYVHASSGPGRYRVDGRVTVGDNVYIGSRSLILGGIAIGDKVVVGAGMTVSRNLDEPGFYVSTPMRVLPLPIPPGERDDLVQLETAGLLETVFVKKR